jgi:hypothetical protein
MTQLTAATPPDLDQILRNGIVKVVERDRETLVHLAALRQHCEKAWLQRAMLRYFGTLSSIQTSEQVRMLSGVPRKVVDLVLTCETGTTLLELKSVVTNYTTASGGGGKPITQMRDGVIKDLTLLSRYVGGATTGFVLWIAYPIPDYNHCQWRRDHYVLVDRSSDGTEELCEPINVGNAYAHVYLSRARPIVTPVSP